MPDDIDPLRVALAPSAREGARLPPPTPAQQAVSTRLSERIRAEIAAAGGSIDFARYMELALYAPGLGYYVAGAQKLGEAGDFVTAPELSPVFARCLARQVREILERLGDGDIVEAGAGSGMLAAGLLQELERLGAPPDRYRIIEVSPDLRARQQALIAAWVPRLASRVYWLDRLPEPGLRAVVLGNEVLDAMPVDRFLVADDGIRALHVAWDGGRFVWCDRPADPGLERRARALGLPPGYRSEINRRAEAWIGSFAERLEAGVLLLIDYGFPQAEFYHPERREGTLMCHYRHRAHDDPLILVGLQDITAHVDFTAIAEAGVQAGLEVLGYTSQAAFLVASGLEQILSESDPNAAAAHLELTRGVKLLTLPSEMGELYKVIALGRGIEPPLRGFALQDRRGRL